MKTIRLILGVVSILVVLAFTVSYAEDEKTYILEENITYGKGGDVELKLDLARPASGEGPFPTLVFIHGGGWGWYPGFNRSQYDFEIIKAAERRYVAVTVDHRLISVKENDKVKYPFPAQVHDIKCAVRWLRANAEKYKIDPNRIGAVGWSSGAHLAFMLGLTDPSHGLEGECGNMKYSSRVQAVVSLAGTTEFISRYQDTGVSFIVALLGGTPEEVPDQYKAASPLNYVSKDDPPVLSIQGEWDLKIAPTKQAERLDAKMKEVGASHTLIIKKAKGHNVFVDDDVWDFFDEHLKGD